MGKPARFWRKLTSLRTRPHALERWLWIIACLALALLSIDFTIQYDQAKAVAADDAILCSNYYLAPATNTFIRAVFGLLLPVICGIAALLTRQRWFVEIVLAATLPVFLVHLVITGWLRVNMREIAASAELIHYAKVRALAIGVLILWLFILLLRDVLPEGKASSPR